MKPFPTLFTINNIVAVATLALIFAPVTYAMNQTAVSEQSPRNSTSSTSSGLVATKNEVKLNFSTSTFDISRDSKVEVSVIRITRVKLGIVQTVDANKNTFVIQVENRPKDVLFAGKMLSVENTATTTFYFGNGEGATATHINVGMNVYVFGYLTSDNEHIIASKVVIANK